MLNTQRLAVEALGGIDKWENRMNSVGSWAKVLRDSNLEGGIVTADLKAQAQASQGRGLNINVLDTNPNVSIGSSRVVDLPIVPGSSQKVPVTFVTIHGSISSTPALHVSNNIGREKAWMNDFKTLSRLMANQLNTLAKAYIDTNKTAEFNDTLGYTNNAGVLEVPLSARPQILGQTNVISNSNDYLGKIEILGNGQTHSLSNEISEKGAYNSDDKTYQWADKNFYFDYTMGSAVGANAEFYVIPEGATGCLIRQDVDAIMENISTYGQSMQVVSNPYVGVPMSEYSYSKYVDFSAQHGAATEHLGRTMVEFYSYLVEVAFIPPFLSDSDDPKPIYKVSVKDV